MDEKPTVAEELEIAAQYVERCERFGLDSRDVAGALRNLIGAGYDLDARLAALEHAQEEPPRRAGACAGGAAWDVAGTHVG